MIDKITETFVVATIDGRTLETGTPRLPLADTNIYRTRLTSGCSGERTPWIEARGPIRYWRTEDLTAKLKPMWEGTIDAFLLNLPGGVQLSINVKSPHGTGYPSVYYDFSHEVCDPNWCSLEPNFGYEVGIYKESGPGDVLAVAWELNQSPHVVAQNQVSIQDQQWQTISVNTGGTGIMIQRSEIYLPVGFIGAINHFFIYAS